MSETGDFLHGEIAVGIAVSLLNFAVHAAVMGVIGWMTHRGGPLAAAASGRIRLVLAIWSIVTVLMLAHLAEVGIWALTYRMLAVTAQPRDSFYFAFVNYATLGYGDVIAVKDWRLLGPMTAMNGMLLFGWSVAVIYDVLRTLARIAPAAPGRPE
jgi:hypothetical protein